MGMLVALSAQGWDAFRWAFPTNGIPAAFLTELARNTRVRKCFHLTGAATNSKKSVGWLGVPLVAKLVVCASAMSVC
jgi:hypothetical protein